MRVKICGVTLPAEVDACAAAGADEVGVVVAYPRPVPWNLEPGEAARLLERVPAGIARVAVVGGDAQAILRVAEAVRPDALQLHADEPAHVVAAVAEAVRPWGIRIIKAIRVPADAAAAGRPEDWRRMADAFAAAGADEILFDSASARRPGGSGERFEWSLVREAAAHRTRPVLLAGGLTPDNVADAVRAVRPDGVDVISGVEGPGHRKDPALVRAFVAAARS